MKTLDAPTGDTGNAVIAHTLHWLAVLQEIDEAGSERVAAFRAAAYAVRQLDRPVSEVLRASGTAGLERLGIAPGIAAMVAEWLRTGELPVLETSQRRQHGLWPALARALCKTLGISPGKKPNRLRPAAPLRQLAGRTVWESWN